MAQSFSIFVDVKQAVLLCSCMNGSALAGGTHGHDAAWGVYHGPGAETKGVGQALWLWNAVIWTKRR